ncbi:MAG: beta-lactamase family protein [Clostridia bacterium]|nr:beta-lactamase family protein [Clostridia bacterium]
MYDFKEIKEYLDALHEKYGIPGGGIAVYQNGEKLYEYCMGYSDSEKTQPATPDTRYFLYSCTKPVTVTAAMMLVARGKLLLDAPVSDYLPAYANAYLLIDGEKKKPDTVMTVRHLFTMSGGLDYNFATPAVVACQQATNGEATTRELVDAFIEDPLAFEPGDHFKYSRCHDVLAAVVEVASGMRFGEFLKTEIFEPLGMNDTGFADYSDVAAQYIYSRERGIEEIGRSNPHILSHNYESGGAGLISTLADYGKFAAMLAADGKAPDGRVIIPRAAIDELRGEQLTALVKNPAFDCAAGPGYGYGLGVRTLVDKSQGQRPPLGEFGWDGAAGAYLMIDVENGIGIAYVQHVRAWNFIDLGHPLHAPMRDGVYRALGL